MSDIKTLIYHMLGMEAPAHPDVNLPFEGSINERRGERKPVKAGSIDQFRQAAEGFKKLRELAAKSRKK